MPSSPPPALLPMMVMTWDALAANPVRGQHAAETARVIEVVEAAEAAARQATQCCCRWRCLATPRRARQCVVAEEAAATTENTRSERSEMLLSPPP